MLWSCHCFRCCSVYIVSLRLSMAQVRCACLYTREQCFGSGSFGTVYTATITTNATNCRHPLQVAVKVIAHVAALDPPGDERLNEESTNRWDALLGLRHENLVRFYQITLSDRHVEILMEHFSDGDLAAFIKKHLVTDSRLPLNKVVDYGKQISEGLAYLHAYRDANAKGMIHGDLDPKNILLRRKLGEFENTLLITDYEDRTDLQNSCTDYDVKRLTGKAAYISPEMAKRFVASARNDVGRATDVWSLGCILLELLLWHVGRKDKWMIHHPRTRVTLAVRNIAESKENMNKGELFRNIANGYVPELHTDLDTVRKDVICVVKRCLRPDPKMRISAADLSKALARTERRPWHEVTKEQHVFTSLLEEGLDDDLCSEDTAKYVDNICSCIRTILDYHEDSSCHGGIFLSNISYRCKLLSNGNPDTETKLEFLLGKKHNPLKLWSEWLAAASPNYVAYIPPEGVRSLPVTAGDTKKADSWMTGCLVAHLFNYGIPLTFRCHASCGVKSEQFQPSQPFVLNQLQGFYAVDKGSTIAGPEIPLQMTLRSMPYACEEFLAHALEPNADKRWTLKELKTLPFADMTKTFEHLIDMDPEYWKVLPNIELSGMCNIRQHPFLKSNPDVQIEVAETALSEGPFDEAGFGSRPTSIERWTFRLVYEEDRQRYTEAFGQLLHLLRLETSISGDDRVQAELSGIRALEKGSENIVRHFGCQFVSPPDDLPQFLVYAEHYPGGTFATAVSHFLPVYVIGKWMMSLLYGLNFLHAHGIVHRNLSSYMVFFAGPEYTGTVKIGGFHNMRRLESSETRNNEVSAHQSNAGPFAFPEMTNIGRKSDIWSVGCIALHLVTGRLPLYLGSTDNPLTDEAGVQNHLNSTRKLPIIDHWVPPRIKEFIRKCLQFEPDKRPWASDLLSVETERDGLFDFTDVHRIITEERIAEYEDGRGGTRLPDQTLLRWCQY